MVMRLQVYEINQKDKNKVKIIIVENNDFETFLKQACNKFKINNYKNAKIFLPDGTQVISLKELKDGSELILSPKGDNMVNILDSKKKIIKKEITSVEEKMKILDLESKEDYEKQQEERKKAFFKISNSKFNKLPKGISEIIENFLYIGSAVDAQDEEQLNKNKINFILNVAVGWKINKKLIDLGIFYDEVLIEDSQHEILLPHFEKCFKFINNTKKIMDKPRILIHCISGILFLNLRKI
jgi:hypothetical protein